MSIQAIFPPGQTEITVNGLHQWDYGRQLEIRSDDLPAMVEIHFACQGMKDAPVRVCNAVSGVATVTIPDLCLEQTTPVTAWIYEVRTTSGKTIKTVTLPISARLRPPATESIPEEFSDKYTEAMAGFNEAVETLKDGSVVVAKAMQATNADEADTATLSEGLDLQDNKNLVIGSDDTCITIDQPGLYLMTFIEDGGERMFTSLIAVEDLDCYSYGAVSGYFSGDDLTRGIHAYYDKITHNLGLSNNTDVVIRLRSVYRISAFGGGL